VLSASLGLYEGEARAIIEEHQLSPRHHGRLPPPALTVEGANPVCGDQVLLSLRLDPAGQKIEALTFDGRSCSIATASASMMTEALQGLEVAEAQRWYQTFKALVTNHPEQMAPDLDLGDLEALEVVKRSPIRIKCALLPWEALRQALAEAGMAENG